MRRPQLTNFMVKNSTVVLSRSTKLALVKIALQGLVVVAVLTVLAVIHAVAAVVAANVATSVAAAVVVVAVVAATTDAARRLP